MGGSFNCPTSALKKLPADHLVVHHGSISKELSEETERQRWIGADYGPKRATGPDRGRYRPYRHEPDEEAVMACLNQSKKE
jgi:hypothetical protein